MATKIPLTKMAATDLSPTKMAATDLLASKMATDPPASKTATDPPVSETAADPFYDEGLLYDEDEGEGEYDPAEDEYNERRIAEWMDCEPEERHLRYGNKCQSK